MNLLLWWLADDPRLLAKARRLIRAAPLAFVSAATTWELALKVSLGKLRMPEDFLQVVEAEGFIYLPVAPEHAWATRDLPWRHRDRFDCFLVG